MAQFLGFDVGPMDSSFYSPFVGPPQFPGSLGLDEFRVSGELPSGGVIVPPPPPTNPGPINLDGVLKTATATMDGLMSAWKTVKNFEISADLARLQADTIKGDISVRNATAESAQELAKLQTRTNLEIEKQRANAQVAIASNQAAVARGGGVYMPSDSTQKIIGIVGLAVAVFFGFKSLKGAK